MADTVLTDAEIRRLDPIRAARAADTKEIPLSPEGERERKMVNSVARIISPDCTLPPYDVFDTRSISALRRAAQVICMVRRISAETAWDERVDPLTEDEIRHAFASEGTADAWAADADVREVVLQRAILTEPE
jgi:predicted ABC-class ATPase